MMVGGESRVGRLEGFDVAVFGDVVDDAVFCDVVDDADGSG